MKLRKVKIKNFRKLSDITFNVTKDLSIIVGPNAAGKSTIFEAIRLCKAILFPRLQDELRNVLISLGATSAHFFNGQLNFDISAIAGSLQIPVYISLTLELSEREIEILQNERNHLVQSLIAAQMGRPIDDPLFDIRAYLSTEIGKNNEIAATKAADEAIASLKANDPFEIWVEIAPGQIRTSDAVYNAFIGHLERRLTPDKALISYFPADRSMPTGEVAMQVGPQDYKAQVDSHLSQAGAKYGRLKQTVVNFTILGKIGGFDLKPDFDSIFDTFLPGREFVGLLQKSSGLLSVQVKNKDTGSVFDIDSLSSGEKGLVLSFLLFKASITIGSIVLVDELELHLNPAVCRKIVPYLMQSVISANECQFLVSTHSAEIMRDGYDKEYAQLFHLRSGTDISPVLPQDTQEYIEAISRLGINAEQALTSTATLFVEGDTDIAVLEAAFGDLLSNVQLKSLNGRTEVEKTIRELQGADARGNLKELHAFLFDHDRKNTDLSSSRYVHVEQLQKYCLENYLLDEELIYDFLIKNSKNPPESRGAFYREIKELAISQLEKIALEELLSEVRSIRLAVKRDEIKNKSIAEIASLQLRRLQDSLNAIEKATQNPNWITDFQDRLNEKKSDLQPIWENEWKKLCSGKELFSNMQRKYQINVNPEKMKVTLATNVAKKETDDITALRGVIGRLLETTK